MDQNVGAGWHRLKIHQSSSHPIACSRGLLARPVTDLLHDSGIIGLTEDVDTAITLNRQRDGGRLAHPAGGDVNDAG
jgi:hypothetical protein